MTPLSKSRRLLLQRLHRRKTRQRERLFLAEGTRCVRTVLRSACRTRFAVLADELSDDATALLAELQSADVEIHRVEATALREVADTESPQGVVLVAEQPDLALGDVAGKRWLLLDAVQDPGNVGALIRSAAALGVEAVVALDGTADPYSPKAVRASAGTVARLPVLGASWPQVSERVEQLGMQLLVASADGDDVGLVDRAKSWALVLANEGAGARAEIVASRHRDVAVAILPDIDSLNVAAAGAILLYALNHAGS